MTVERTLEYLHSLLRELLKLSKETEWVEFKHNNEDPQAIGEYISALANAAALVGKQSAYLVWGVDNDSHDILGTSFRPSTTKHKQQELESWLLQKTAPKIHFHFHEFEAPNGEHVVILEVQAASHTPVQFDGTEYIRIGSYKKKLREFPEKERELWRIFDRIPFEKLSAAENLLENEVLKLLDYPAYFDLTDQSLPEGRAGILAALEADKLIQHSDSGLWHITNLGAILFAKRLQDFGALARKAVRLVLYRGNNKLETVRELEGAKGYAVGFEGLIDYLKTLLPSNEEIGKAFRSEVPMYPELAIRELVANAIIHQDFTMTGTGPMVELFDSRMEITNPGIPLMDPQRFLDTPPQSRNEVLASFMRRIGICEERGSGIDKVITEVEFYQLSAPIFEQTQNHTRTVLFAHKEHHKMDSEDKIRACYQHCCLRHVNREPMNNASVRKRFRIDEGNSAIASRIIKLAVEAGLIRLFDSAANRKSYRYVPFWA
ncbi:MAG: ATP-binding protein [Mariprofundaceae bacterium]|nr:ATP-binding protein [Mariprofundaceae bacterium]